MASSDSLHPCLHTHRHTCALSLGEGSTSLEGPSGFRILKIILQSNFIF